MATSRSRFRSAGRAKFASSEFAALSLAALTPAGVAAQNPGAAPAPTASKPLPLKHAPEPTTAAIKPADLMTRLYIFADDSMMGREVGTA